MDTDSEILIVREFVWSALLTGHPLQPSARIVANIHALSEDDLVAAFVVNFNVDTVPKHHCITWK